MSIPLPKLSRRKRGWTSGDPPVSSGKSVSQRKSARDGGLTPTERRQKDKLMRQFQRMPEGQSGNSTAYTESPLWCAHPGCHRTNGTHEHADVAGFESQLARQEWSTDGSTPWRPPASGNGARGPGDTGHSHDANEVEAR